MAHAIDIELSVVATWLYNMHYTLVISASTMQHNSLVRGEEAA